MNAVGLRFEHVGVERDGNAVVADFTASVPAGTVTALIGPNGAGKSTLINAALGMVSHAGRVVFVRDGAPSAIMPRIGFVPQRFAPDRNLPLTALEFLVCATQRRPLWLFGMNRRARGQALALLDAVRAPHTANRPLGVLSGGEIQRVLLANALLRRPELLILDEPDAGVDAAGEGLFCEVLEEQRATLGFTQLMVSHNIALVLAHARHVILMNRTVLAEGPTAEVLTSGPLQEAFGMHMAIPDRPCQCPGGHA